MLSRYVKQKPAVSFAARLSDALNKLFCLGHKFGTGISMIRGAITMRMLQRNICKTQLNIVGICSALCILLLGNIPLENVAPKFPGIGNIEGNGS